MSNLYLNVLRVGGRRSVVALKCVIAFATCGLIPPAMAQEACPPYAITSPPCYHVWGPPVHGTESAPPPVIPSRCWYTVCSSDTDPAIGYPLNLSMGFGLAMGDYPPLTLDAMGSTLPVVGREGSYHARAVPAAIRPTLNGVVDLITGVPLLQETDFELNYGTAVFRHIRTYSEIPSTFTHENPCTHGNWGGEQGPRHAADHYWDWQGTGWMIGENPILLIDAAYEGTVYPAGSRHSYFIVDSHHSIPFTFLPDIAQYEAPPRFDAIMHQHGGVWQPAAGEDPGHWDPRPTEFTIWLQHQSVKYTIKPVYEDELVLDGASMHWPPHPNPSPPTGGLSQGQPMIIEGRKAGPGIPHYGLVTRIEDRYGNRAEMEYCSVGLVQADEPSTGCVECSQQCHRKGRLSRVKLFAAGQTAPTWTIVYVGREFQASPLENGTYLQKRQEAIHSIYVYEGDVTAPECLTISNQTFVDALDVPPSGGGPNEDIWLEGDLKEGLRRLDAVNVDIHVPANWVHKVQYLYSETNNLFKSVAAAPRFGSEGYWGNVLISAPRLIKATVYRKVPGEPASQTHAAVVRHTLYRYRHLGVPNSHHGASQWDPVSMSAVWESQAIDGIRAAAEAVGGTQNEELLEHWPLGLLVKADNELVPVRAANETEIEEFENRPVLEVASLSFRHWGEERFGRYDSFTSQAGTGFRDEIVTDYLAAELPGNVALRDGVFTFVDRRNGGKDGRVFKVYRFWHLAQDIRPGWAVPTPFCGWTVPTSFSAGFGYDTDPFVSRQFPFRAVMRDPFCFYGEFPGIISPIPTDKKLPLDQPFWVTVIDEYESLKDATFDAGTDYTDLAGVTSTVGDRKPPKSRRAVRLNPAGYKLSERNWDIASGAVASEGMFEEFEYDADGMLVEHRTYGWGNNETQEGTNYETQGLINRYAYPSVDQANRGKLSRSSAFGVQKGKPSSGTPAISWVRQTINHPQRTELPLYDISFPTPYTGDLDWVTPFNSAYAAAGAQVTKYEYLFKDTETTKHIVWKKTIGPPAKRHPDVATLYYPFSCEVYNSKGNTLCRAYGNVADPANPGTGDDVLYVDVLAYNAQGQLLSETIDHDQSPSGTDPTFVRHAPFDALKLRTEYDYDVAGQLKRVTYPNGRHDLRTERVVGDQVETREYKLVWVDDCRVYAPVPGTMTQRSIEGGSVGNMISAQWEVIADVCDNPPNPEQMQLSGLVPLCSLTPGYDSSGRVSSMTVDGGDGNTLTASIQYDYIGEITRQRDPDGTLTRNVHDPLGRLERVFRGTEDFHPYWGTAEPNSPPYLHDNMILVEGRRYGEGTTDARQLTEVITYRDVERDAAHVPALPDGGSSDLHHYDWRMRGVLVEHRGEAIVNPPTPGGVLSWSATYLDNLGRVRFTATFGPLQPTGAANPTTLAFAGTEPAAADIKTGAGMVGGSTNLLRLSETIYNARGQVQEQRQYDPETLKYLSTRTYYDHAGRPLYIQSPNGGIQTFVYDVRGRQVESRLLAGGGTEEITRTETTYDSDNNALITSTWERTHDGTGDVLGAANAVCTRTFNWYDAGNRLVATADLGADIATAGTTGFVNAAGTQRTRPADAPEPVYDTVSNPDLILSINLQGLPETAKVTCYQYDSAGRRVAVIRHNTVAGSGGSTPRPEVTRTIYNGLGQVLYQIENANDFGVNKQRITAYAYERDRLKKIGAILDGVIDVDWQTSVNHQITELLYEAKVIKPGFASFSPENRNNAWVSEVRFPDAATGQPSTWDRLEFEYFTDGRVATRTDQRGVSFQYSYDVPGNLTKVEVGNIAATGQGGSVPADSINVVEFEYDVLGNPKDVKAKAAGGSNWVAHNVMAYDSRGNLTLDRQSHGEQATSASPQITYTWSYSGFQASSDPQDGYNFDRLASMLYPKRVQAPTIQRELDVVYGDTLAARDSILGRVTRIEDNRLGEAARYQYAGSSRRVSQQYGNDAGSQTAPVSQSYADSSQNPVVGYPGLDPYGRVKDLHFRNASPTNSTLQRFEYGHDPLDQRVFARVTQRSSTGTAVENERSSLYGYDTLGRLVSSKLGQLDSTNASVMPGSLPAVRDSLWTMDLLGNWVGDTQQSLPGRRTLGVPQTTGPPTREVSSTDAVNRTNAISQRQTLDGTTTTPLNPVHDAAGNLVLDADYFYQYDAWNRLIQVSEKGMLSLSLGTGGTLAVNGYPGPWIVHYTYDGLGRLIRKQSPWPTLDPFNRPQVRTEHFYYDGVRRIQETITDPLVNDGGDDPIGIDKEAELPPLQTQTLTSREYIHSPGYVDEVVAQVDVPLGTAGNDRPAWVIQDANYNVVALIDDSGVMLHQYTWDPYGQPVQVDQYDTGINGAPAPFENRIGHQGLFFDRFDGGTNNVLMQQVYVNPATGLAAKGLYQNRNRSYSPSLGRFVQRDPYGAACEAIHGLRQLGTRVQTGGPAVNATLLTSVGPNRFAYCRGSPVANGDPQGLFDLSLTGLMFASTSMNEMRMEWMEDVGTFGMSLAQSLGGIFDAVAMDQMADADWAMDWSQPDDFYSSSASYAQGTGSWADWYGSSDRDDEADDARGAVIPSDFGLGKPGRIPGGGVYHIIDEATQEVVWVGRTVSFKNRWQKHKKRFAGCRLEPIHSNLTHDEMRGLEQHELNRAKTRRLPIKNTYRGVDKFNRNRGAYALAARSYLRGRRR